MFLLRLSLALLLATIAAALLAPPAALLITRAGFHLPFPRVFDRTVMLTTVLVLISQARGLRLLPLIQSGFANPSGLASRVQIISLGLAISLLVIAILWIMAIIIAPLGARIDWLSITVAVPRLTLAAAIIAFIEEAFFRAFLLKGLVADFGSRPALIISSAFYSAAHLVRSPARFYLTSLDWIAGFRCIASGLSNLAAPESAATLFGLFLLGLLLGRAFLATAGVYLSIGLHTGFVFGAKLWRLGAPTAALLPHWLGGYGSQPMISGVAAWIAALVLLVFIGPISCLATPSESQPQSS